MVGVGGREGGAWWPPALGIRASQGTLSSVANVIHVHIWFCRIRISDI